MTPTQAIDMLTGPRGIANPDLGCLGEADLLALQTLLEAYKSQRAALAGLLDPAAACFDDWSSILESGLMTYDDDDRNEAAEKACDDLFKAIQTAEKLLAD